MARIRGNRRNDVIDGTSDADRILAGAGDDVASGLAGDDRIYGGDGGDLLFGDQEGSELQPIGSDRLFGEAGDDRLVGGYGDDVLSGGDGDDALYSAVASLYERPDGSRELSPSANIDGGDDVLSGGAGNDRAIVSLYRDLPISLVMDGEGNGRFRVDGVSATRLESIEELTIFASEAADDFVLDGGDDTVIAFNGDDRILAGGGDDAVEGGFGNDYIDGGEGIDYVSYFAQYSEYHLYLDLSLSGRAQGLGFFGVDTLVDIENIYVYGLRRSDAVLTGDASANEVQLVGSFANVVVSAGEGADVVTLDGIGYRVDLAGYDGDDLLSVGPQPTGFESQGAVYAYGGAGDDRIEVASGRVVVAAGDAGDDYLLIDASAGEFVIGLGEGRDVLALDASSGRLVDGNAIGVVDFTAGAGGDVLDLGRAAASGALRGLPADGDLFASGHLRLVQVDTATRLDVDRNGGGNGFVALLTFNDTRVEAYTAANFSLAGDDGLSARPSVDSAVAAFHPDAAALVL